MKYITSGFKSIVNGFVSLLNGFFFRTSIEKAIEDDFEELRKDWEKVMGPRELWMGSSTGWEDYKKK